MVQVDFGLFDWIDRDKAPLHQLYEERLQLLEVADTAGFFCYHLAEHHATPSGHGPFARIVPHRSGAAHSAYPPGTTSLPAASLQPPEAHRRSLHAGSTNLDGRLELGVGRGVSPYELGYFGVDVDGTRAIFDETLAVLVAGMTNERLTFEGNIYQYHNAPMELCPMQQPYPPLWYPTHTSQRASNMQPGTATISWASARPRT